MCLLYLLSLQYFLKNAHEGLLEELEVRNIKLSLSNGTGRVGSGRIVVWSSETVLQKAFSLPWLCQHCLRATLT